MATFDTVAARVLRWRAEILYAAQAAGVPVTLLAALIHDESGGDPEAFPEHPERDGASFGLCQVLLPTARAVGFNQSAPHLFSPGVSTFFGAKYLAGLIREYTNPWLALVGYNGGPRAVTLYRLGWRYGTAVHYANTVWALRARYENGHTL